MDQAVLAAYGWSDIAVPPYCIATDADRAALQAFEDEVLDRLFVLNEQRAEQEAALGRGGKKSKASARSPKATATAAEKPKRKGKRGKNQGTPSGQGSLDL